MDSLAMILSNFASCSSRSLSFFLFSAALLFLYFCLWTWWLAAIANSCRLELSYVFRKKASGVLMVEAYCRTSKRRLRLFVGSVMLYLFMCPIFLNQSSKPATMKTSTFFCYPFLGEEIVQICRFSKYFAVLLICFSLWRTFIWCLAKV